MLFAKFYYPHPTVTVHKDKNCAKVSNWPASQRQVTVNAINISDVLSDFASNSYPFASNSRMNDLLVEVDFGNNYAFEISVLKHLQEILTRFYKPFATALFNFHC